MTLEVTTDGEDHDHYGTQDKNKKEKATNYHSAEQIALGVAPYHLIKYAGHKICAL
jgi:hypothetical protein